MDPMTRYIEDQFISAIIVPAVGESISLARRHTRNVLGKWHMMPLVDDAELIVSELTTNGVKAIDALPTEPPAPSQQASFDVLCLTLCLIAPKLAAPELLIELWDPAPQSPQRRETTLDDEGGRGLWVVEALSKEWGTRRPATGGKVVWARCTSPQPIRSPNE
jgi:hypothetical protein